MNLTELSWIVFLITSAVYIGIIYSFFNACFTCRLSKKLEIFIFVSFYFVDSIFFIINNPVINVVWSVLVLGILALMYNGDLKTRLSSAIFIYIIGFLADFLIACLVVFMRNISFNDIAFGTREYIFGIIASKILIIVFTRFLSNYIGGRKMSKIHSAQWLYIVLTPLGSIIIIYNLFMSYYRSRLPIGIVLSAIIVIVINFLVLNVYEKILSDFEIRTKNQLLQQQIMLYSYQNYLAEASEKVIRKTKHDITNLLFGFKIDIRNKNIDKTESRVNQLLGEINLLDGPAKSGNLAIDSIINFKADMARKQNIEFEIALDIPNNLILESTSMCVILGNIIDNAIEATGEVMPQERRIVEVIATYSHSNLLLQVKNPYVGAIHTGRNGEVFSKKREWKSTGLGLYSVQKELETFCGTMDIDFSDQIFSIEIMLYSIKTNNTPAVTC